MISGQTLIVVDEGTIDHIFRVWLGFRRSTQLQIASVLGQTDTDYFGSVLVVFVEPFIDFVELRVGGHSEDAIVGSLGNHTRHRSGTAKDNLNCVFFRHVAAEKGLILFDEASSARQIHVVILAVGAFLCFFAGSA